MGYRGVLVLIFLTVYLTSGYLLQYHPASEISPGSFLEGNYTFPLGFLNFSSILFVDNYTGYVGVGSPASSYLLEVSGNFSAEEIYQGGNLVLDTSTSFSGDVTGNYSNLQLGDGVVGSSKVDSSQVQLRIVGSCLSGEFMRVVNEDGTVVCEGEDDSLADVLSRGNVAESSAWLNVSGGSLKLGPGSQNHSYIGFYQEIGGEQRVGWIGYGEDGSTDLSIVNQHLGSIEFRTNDTPRMVIDDGGWVGIGTTSPDERLEVNGTIYATRSLRVGINVETLTSDKTLIPGIDAMYQYLSPGDGNRVIILDDSNAEAGDRFIIRHNGAYDSVYYLKVKQGDITLDYIYGGAIKEFIFNGTEWISAGRGSGENDNKKHNVAIGYSARGYSSGTAVGYGAYGDTYGAAVGHESYGYNYGAAVGYNAKGYRYGAALGYKAKGLRYGVAVGYQAGYNIYGGADGYNTLAGAYSGYRIATGRGNIILGYKSGYDPTYSPTTGSYNILIGYQSWTPSQDTSNFLNIGGLIFGTDLATTPNTISNGNVGIGTVNPEYRLEVAGGVNLNNTLYVNESTGYVGIGNDNPGEKLDVNGVLYLHDNMIRRALIWPPSYDSRGSFTALPGFEDTLYYATKRGITVEANRGPDSGSLDDMFDLYHHNFALWNNVNSTNPVSITITYPSDIFLTGIVISFGFRNSHAIDYTVEYYHDDNVDGTYEWHTFATVTGNTRYEVYHIAGRWKVAKIRINVTKAGDGDKEEQLRIATIQAISSIHGKATGHMVDVGGDTMYGDLHLSGSGSDLFVDGKVGIGTTNPGHKLQVGEDGDGTSAIANAWNTFSDIRYKENITEIEHGLDLVSRMRGVRFNWKRSGKSDLGLIAQEVEQVVPEVVSTDSEGYKSIEYSKLVSVLIEAIKEQQSEIELQKRKIEEQKLLICLLYTSPSPRDLSTSRMPSSA